MKKLFYLLFHGRILLDRNDRRCHVRVTNSKTGQRLWYGAVRYVDFKKRELCIAKFRNKSTEEFCIRLVSFDNIVSISRMQDGRLHLWITTLENSNN